jgi:dTDP-4-dehydrorhamnose 3,5-epimerase
LPYHAIPTALTGVLILEPKIFKDDRGFFYESYNQRDFTQATGLDVHFVQDNHSQSKKGVLRGMHYQISHAQGKLVRVTCGEVFDVSVNLQRNHPEFGKWVGVHLSDKNHRQLWIPPGFAHGFLVLSDQADFIYKTTDYYSQQDERCLLWNDPEIGINWPIDGAPTLTAKDSLGACLKDADVYE